MAKTNRCQISSQPMAITKASTMALMSSSACSCDDDVAAVAVRSEPGERRHERLRQVADAAHRADQAAEPVRSYDSQPMVVSWIHMAADWNALPSQTRRKSRYLKA